MAAILGLSGSPVGVRLLAPGPLLPAVLCNLEFLGGKAIANSRAKKPWKALAGAEAGA